MKLLKSPFFFFCKKTKARGFLKEVSYMTWEYFTDLKGEVKEVVK